MGQVSKVLRSGGDMYSHWCPGCGEMHFIPTDRDDGPNWSFDGNVDAPTFNPSVRIGGKLTVKVNGRWTGEWVRDAAGNAVDMCCHYFLHAGVLKYCSDSTHALAGQEIPLPELPDGFRDGEGT